VTGDTGAIIQRDGKTFALLTRSPAGIVTPEHLERVAAVARKYRIPVLKITGGQRIALIGIAAEDIAKVRSELGPGTGEAEGPSLKYVQACPGNTICRHGLQDSLSLATVLADRFRHTTFPAKVKIGVSGCPRCCGESHTRDIGLLATNKGWTVLFAGNEGTRPRFGDIVAKNLTGEEVMDLVDRLLAYYRGNAKPHERTARFMERTGMEILKSDLLQFMPYIPIGEVKPA